MAAQYQSGVACSNRYMDDIIATCKTEPLFLYSPVISETYSYIRHHVRSKTKAIIMGGDTYMGRVWGGIWEDHKIPVMLNGITKSYTHIKGGHKNTAFDF